MTLAANARHLDRLHPAARGGQPAPAWAVGAPARVLVAHHIDEVKPVLEAVHAAAEAGHWCVGHAL